MFLSCVCKLLVSLWAPSQAADWMMLGCESNFVAHCKAETPTVVRVWSCRYPLPVSTIPQRSLSHPGCFLSSLLHSDSVFLTSAEESLQHDVFMLEILSRQSTGCIYLSEQQVRNRFMSLLDDFF